MSPETAPFLFPATSSAVLPDPSRFFSSSLSSPLPTNSFFQNFALKNGDQPEYIHPYLIRLFLSSLSLCYPSRSANSSVVSQIFAADLTVSAAGNLAGNHHEISSFTDLSVTIDFPGSNLRFFLVRGSPFVTCEVSNPTNLSISTIHAIDSYSSNDSETKHVVKLNNTQTWVIYSSSPLKLKNDNVSVMNSDPFSGTIRVALVPDSDPKYESILDTYSSCYPINGEANFTKPFCMDYSWDTKGQGELLMLAHPLHLKLLQTHDPSYKITILDDFKYKSIDGDLVGVVGDRWSLKTQQIPITWHSIHGIDNEESYNEIVSALLKDVEALDSSSMLNVSASYFYGKLIARAARLALIAEEVSRLDAIPKVKKFLKDSIEPWLDGKFNANGFLYESKWGGIVTKLGSTDSTADFGFGVYNDHHYHLGYFLYAIAVLAKIDPSWGWRYRPQAYAMVSDFMNLGKPTSSKYTRLRCFDLYKLHSWAGGLTEFADGRNQESTSEAVNAYYSAALLGLSYGDLDLVFSASTLTAMEMLGAQTWWHVKHDDSMYEEVFTAENRLIGVLWANKRDTGLWFAPPYKKEIRIGIQVLPITPILEVLFPDVGFVKEMVEWAMPSMARKGVEEGWKGFNYAMEAVYDKESALEKVRNELKGFDNGNSMSNLLWWVHSRS